MLTAATLMMAPAQLKAQNTCTSIEVGTVVEDPATFNSLGFSLPILSGDADYDASVSVRYRQSGSTQWRQALPMLRVRPETISGESKPPAAHTPIAEQFAGSIMGLNPGTSYSVEFNLVDPDGCDVRISATATTRSIPPSEPARANVISVSSFEQLQSAINSASAGDVITVSAGTYTAPSTGAAALSIQGRRGTYENPIIIRGEDRANTIIDGNGNREVILARDTEYVYIEDLTVRNGEYGIRLSGNSIGTVVQGNIVRDVTIGIWAKNYIKRDLMICDNDLRGGVIFPQTDSSTWDFEGIVFHGSGGVVCHNTIAGFGDAVGFSKAQEADAMPPHRGNDIYGNDILWSGDDCIEFDYSERNNRAFDNRCTNTANGISFQPVFGGPAYAYRNIVYNPQKDSVLKPNNTPSGIYIYHNLLSLPWTNYSSRAYNVEIQNNLFIGNPQDIVTDVSTRLLGGSENEVAVIDYNAWNYDGNFRFGRRLPTWGSFAKMQADGMFEQNGIIVGRRIFADESWPLRPALGTFSQPLNNSLHANSDAVDAAVALPTINDDFIGNAPDIGPFESGAARKSYGARWLSGSPVRIPAAPSDLTGVSQ
jgi:hypothetical protein